MEIHRLWVLGASDPEMAAIEALLNRYHETVRYAMADGRRVYPSNAYRATNDPVPQPKESVHVINIECAGPWKSLTNVDHHKPGDFGYGLPPEEYLYASSIGQVMLLLNQFWPDSPIKLTKEIMFTAAADHCLAPAYRGLCPGVDPTELMNWRAMMRAQQQKRPIAEVMSDINRAREILRLQRKIDIIGSDGKLYPVADFGDRTIPELPEASCRENIAFLATVTDPGGARKRVLQSGCPALIEGWMQIAPLTLDAVYGDPQRGFAGGYITRMKGE